MGEKALKKFKKTTGIEQKHCCRKDHVITTGDLCFAAAEKLIKELDVDRQTIDAVILVTQTPDYGIMPATACVLQAKQVRIWCLLKICCLERQVQQLSSNMMKSSRCLRL